MKIVVLDGHVMMPDNISWEPIAALGELVLFEFPSHSTEETLQRIGDAEVVITNKTPLGREVIAGCPNLRYIGALSTGYDVVDYQFAAEKGIPVTNIPAYGTAIVAQFTTALLLELCHRVGLHSDSVHAGDWPRQDWCYWLTPQTELLDKTMGIIGFGRIGQAVGRIAAAMGMQVLATGSRPTEEGRAIADYTDLDTLLREADVVSLHCPALPDTVNLINRETLAKMKPGALLVNASRGALVVEQDVAEALNSGRLAGYAADVAAREPINDDSPLLTAKNCLLTPHMAWAAKETRQRIIHREAENIKRWMEGKPIHVVNGV